MSLDYGQRDTSANRTLELIGRKTWLFEHDLASHGEALANAIRDGRFLVVGGAGSIGGAVVKKLFQYHPRTLHVIDISENGLAELVRDIRSSFGHIDGDFHAYCFDVLGSEFRMLAQSCGPDTYDYVLNFSALKHVRSEKDPLTLMRMINVNIVLTMKLLELAQSIGSKKFFCVSTDKAANPVNMMGASKRLMEILLFGADVKFPRSTARFANVAFSNGSLLHSWTQRLQKRQPIVAPTDVRRYFLTEQEAAMLCLFSVFQGNDGEVFFPKLDEEQHALDFRTLAENFLQQQGLVPVPCETEAEARDFFRHQPASNQWPCYFFESDTTGEKPHEEFFTASEEVMLDRYADIGIVRNPLISNSAFANGLLESLQTLQASTWDKEDLVQLFTQALPEFGHAETGRNLDHRM